MKTKYKIGMDIEVPIKEVKSTIKKVIEKLNTINTEDVIEEEVFNLIGDNLHSILVCINNIIDTIYKEFVH